MSAITRLGIPIRMVYESPVADDNHLFYTRRPGA